MNHPAREHFTDRRKKTTASALDAVTFKCYGKEARRGKPQAPRSTEDPKKKKPPGTLPPDGIHKKKATFYQNSLTTTRKNIAKNKTDRHPHRIAKHARTRPPVIKSMIPQNFNIVNRKITERRQKL